MGNDESAGFHDVSTPEVDARALRHDGCEELYVTAIVDAHSQAAAAFTAAADLVRERGATVVAIRVFGLRERSQEGLDLVEEAFGDIRWPVTWLDEGWRNDPLLAGIEVHATRGGPASPLRLGERVVGSIYEDRFATYCTLGGLLPADTGVSRPVQAKEVFETMAAGLAEAGMGFEHVVRTWLWIEDILSWYDSFNEVRTRFFEENGIFDRWPPASTGIGAHNAAGAALTAELVAMKPKGTQAEAYPVASPLQCSATSYGSSFSRAAEISTPNYRELFVSGTASIAPDGETMHRGDVEKQISRTMEVVGAILESRDMGWGHVKRSVVYFRNAEDAPAFRSYCAGEGLDDMPNIIVHSTVCREDLLFELELDAVRPSQ